MIRPARDIPVTTQAGLFAKLQATIRFMTDIVENELYEDEWLAIKADVQRLADQEAVPMTEERKPAMPRAIEAAAVPGATSPQRSPLLSRVLGIEPPILCGY